MEPGLTFSDLADEDILVGIRVWNYYRTGRGTVVRVAEEEDNSRWDRGHFVEIAWDSGNPSSVQWSRDIVLELA